MRFEIHHRFEQADLHEVEALYLLDDPFNHAVFDRMGYERSVLRHERSGPALTRVLRIVARAAVPPPFSAFARTFYFDETTAYDFSIHKGTWQTVPSVLRDRFRSAGTFALRAKGGAVTFELEGETKADLPLVGRQAEQHAIATARRSHDEIARAVAARLGLVLS